MSSVKVKKGGEEREEGYDMIKVYFALRQGRDLPKGVTSVPIKDVEVFMEPKKGDKDTKDVKNFCKDVKSFYITIYEQIKLGKYPAQISQNLKVSRQKLNYYISFLKAKGLIGKVDNRNYAGWEILKEVTDKELVKITKGRCKKEKLNRNEVEKPVTNLHALVIKFPVLSGVVKDSDWEVKNKLKNWLPKYKRLTNLNGLTVRNNNNKSISVFVKSRDIKDLNEVDNLAFKIRAYVYEYFKAKHGVELDLFNVETKNLNLATEDKKAEGMLRKGEKFELDLGKKAEKIFDKDDIDGKAWLDSSPFGFSVETNDKEWKKAYLQMPFYIRGLASSMPAIMEYARQIRLHKEVQQSQLRTQRLIREAIRELTKEIRKLRGGKDE